MTRVYIFSTGFTEPMFKAHRYLQNEFINETVVGCMTTKVYPFLLQPDIQSPLSFTIAAFLLSCSLLYVLCLRRPRAARLGGLESKPRPNSGSRRASLFKRPPVAILPCAFVYLSLTTNTSNNGVRRQEGSPFGQRH